MNNNTLHALTHHLTGAPAALFPQKELRDLLKLNLASTYYVMSRIEIKTPLKPLFDNRSGEEFDAAHLSYLLRLRVENRPISTLMVSATKKGRRLLSGRFGGKQTRSTDIDHDILLSHVYVSLGSRGWVSEPGLINGEAPDARLRKMLIEIGGSSYTPDKLEARHVAWSEHRYLLF